MNLHQMKAPDGTIYSISPNNVASLGTHKLHSNSFGAASDITSIEIASANTWVF